MDRGAPLDAGAALRQHLQQLHDLQAAAKADAEALAHATVDALQPERQEIERLLKQIAVYETRYGQDLADVSALDMNALPGTPRILNAIADVERALDACHLGRIKDELQRWQRRLEQGIDDRNELAELRYSLKNKAAWLPGYPQHHVRLQDTVAKLVTAVEGARGEQAARMSLWGFEPPEPSTPAVERAVE